MVQARITISKTTPIINFSEIGRLDILESLFGSVIAPPAVVGELLSKQSVFPKAAQVASTLEVIRPEDQLLVQGFRAGIHPGEAECLALAMEHPGSMLLLDDLQARSLASSNNLTFTGTLGCLVEAKARGLIDALFPLLKDLRSSARFWISRDLETRVLADVGES